MEADTYKLLKGNNRIPSMRLYNCKKFNALKTATERSDAIESVRGCVICTAADHDDGRCSLGRKGLTSVLTRLGSTLLIINCSMDLLVPTATL